MPVLPSGWRKTAVQHQQRIRKAERRTEEVSVESHIPAPRLQALEASARPSKMEFEETKTPKYKTNTCNTNMILQGPHCTPRSVMETLRTAQKMQRQRPKKQRYEVQNSAKLNRLFPATSKPKRHLAKGRNGFHIQIRNYDFCSFPTFYVTELVCASLSFATSLNLK